MSRQAIGNVLVPLYQEMLRSMEEVRKCLDIAARVTNALPYCTDLRRPKYRNHPNLLRGHCYVAAEAVYHLALREGIHLKPMFVRYNDEPHWFLVHRSYTKDPAEAAIDPTAGQWMFLRSEDYGKARGKGFLTKQPSKRAAELIRRMEEA